MQSVYCHIEYIIKHPSCFINYVILYNIKMKKILEIWKLKGSYIKGRQRLSPVSISMLNLFFLLLAMHSSRFMGRK